MEKVKIWTRNQYKTKLLIIMRIKIIKMNILSSKIKEEKIKEAWILQIQIIIQRETITITVIQLKIVIQLKKYAGYVMEVRQKIH